jgi:hypothetical protein
MPNPFDIGPYQVQFNSDRYNLEQIDDNSVIAIAIGSSNQTATVSIWMNDPACPLSTDDKEVILNDTGNMARGIEPNLPISGNVALPESKNVDGREGFYACIRYGNVPRITTLCERVICSLDNGYILNIISIYPVTSNEEPRLALIGDIISSIHILRQ